MTLFVKIINKIKFIRLMIKSAIIINGGTLYALKKISTIIFNQGISGGINNYKMLKNNTGDIIKYDILNKKSNSEKVDFRNERNIELNNNNLFLGSNSILFIGHDANLAGSQVLLLSLIKWFKNNTGIKLKIILLNQGTLYDKYNELAPALIWNIFKNNHPNQEKRNHLLKEFIGKVDLVYGNTVLAPAFYEEIKYLNVPIITHVHELEKSIRLYSKKPIIESMKLLTNYYIACSNAVALNLINNHNIDKNKVRTIHAFIEERKIEFKISKKEFRHQLKLQEDGIIIVGCGTIYWRKGVDIFIETAIFLKQKGLSNFHFYWIGENYWNNDSVSLKLMSWEELQLKITKNDLINNITFLGLKDNVFDYYLAGDIFYLPSREDPFPLVCLEAAQCGLPVICFDNAGGMPDFVEKDAGFVIPFEDSNEAANKILFLYNNPQILKELGNSARNKVLLNHIIDIVAPEIFNLCKKTANFNPTVSIILPNYNCENYLEKRMNSLLNQEFKDFEIIILDDFSNDKSIEIIEKYLSYPNIKLYKNNSNSGSPFKQWYKGFMEAKGEIIWFAEADDYCKPDFLKKLLSCFINKNVALAYCDSYIINEKDDLIGDYSNYYEKLDINHWKNSYQVSSVQEINYGLGVKNTIPNASAVLIRKNCITNEIFEETFRFKFAGDWFFYTQVIKEYSIAFYSEKLNYHRKHEQTVSSKFNTDSFSIQLLLKETELVHKSIIDNYIIFSDFLNKWKYYISEQIHAVYPKASLDEFDGFYSYKLIEDRINSEIFKTKFPKNLVFITTNDGSANGGSEQLWRKTAIECKKRNHNVMIVIKKWEPEPMFIKDFFDNGIQVIFKESNHFNFIKEFIPDLVIISIGDQDEGIDYYENCKINNIPYIIVNQLTKEPEFWQIKNNINELVKNGYLNSKQVFFTGKNNHDVMEKRLSCKIYNWSIFYNPFDVDRNIKIHFPNKDKGLQIAIVANLLRIHKGQHLAIELFSMNKWRDRSIFLNIYGKGEDEEFLRKLIRNLKLKNVTFHGHTNDIKSVWKENHAILLPSFMEGLPLVLVGAMLCGRVPILTDIGAHKEVVDDNISGFIAIKPTVDALDEALERAWKNAENWEEIGKNARQKILSIVPEDPINDFISKITPFIYTK